MIAAVDAGSGNTLALTTTNAGPLTLSANVSAAGGAVDLVSAGFLNQAAGVITTASLSGSSVGGASLADANLFDSLAGITNTGVGNASITDAKASGLTVTSLVDAGAGNTLTLTTANGGPLTLSASVSAAGGAVDLVSAGAIDQTAGLITAGTLTGTAVGAATVGGPNLIGSLGPFSTTGPGAGFALSNNQTLTVTGTVAAGIGGGSAEGNLSITTLTGDIILGSGGTGGQLTATAFGGAGGVITLNAAGAITQTAGALTAGEDLSLTAGTIVDLIVAPIIVRDYTISAPSVSSFALTPLFSPGRNFTIDTSGVLDLTQNITVNGTLTLNTTGSIDQIAGVITAVSFKGSSVGGASLTDANQFDTLAGFTNAGAGAVSITDAKPTGMMVTGLVDAGLGNTLTLTTANGGPLTLSANVSAAGGTVDLVSAGVLTQTGGGITTATLTGSSVGGASLAGANLFDILAGFTNSGVGEVSITDAQASGMNVTGFVDPGFGNNLTLANSAGDLIESTGFLNASQDLTLSAAGSLVLSNAPFVPRDYTVTAASFGGLTLDTLPGRDFTVNGLGDLILTTGLAASRNLAVTSTGVLDTSGASLTALSGSMTLQGATGLTVGSTGALSGPTNLITAASGNVVVLGTVDAGGNTVTLTSRGTITEGPNASINAGAVTGSSVGGTTLNSPFNAIGAFGSFTDTANGNVTLADNQPLLLTGAVNIGGGTLILVANGPIAGDGATITAGRPDGVFGGRRLVRQLVQRHRDAGVIHRYGRRLGDRGRQPEPHGERHGEHRGDFDPARGGCDRPDRRDV